MTEGDPSTVSSSALAAAGTDLITARHRIPDPASIARRRLRKRLRRWLGWALGCALLLALVPLTTLWWYSRDLPSLESLANYEPPVATIVRDEQGREVGEFFKEQRYVVPLSAMPQALRDAFVAAEDASFWDHGGVDYEGIARAFVQNLRRRRLAQGGSTITRQVARSFLLTREKTIGRKVREILLSQRIERAFSKEHILYLYLNQIFLGHGAYGVAAAARLYYGKDVGDLSVAESALLAGLPQAPSRYSPNRNYKAAKARQRYVLREMFDRGLISGEQAERAVAEELVFRRKIDRNQLLAPHYVEHVRRYLFAQAQEAEERREQGRAPHAYDGLHPLTSGLSVVIPVDLELQAAAKRALEDGVERSDRLMGWRGPLRTLEEEAERADERDAIDRERIDALFSYHPGFSLPEGPVPAGLVPGLEEGEQTRAIVHELGTDWAVLQVGSRPAVLPLSGWPWCHNVNPERDFRRFRCSRFDDMLTVGDVVQVRIEAARTWEDTLPTGHPLARAELAGVAMDQEPAPDAAVLTMRTSDGAVLAMVGGRAFADSEFNRALQAHRQVGSTFKPFIYAAAMDHPELRYGPASLVLDEPLVASIAGPDGKLWEPRNSSGDFMGQTTLRQSLVLSRNLVTVRICEEIGASWALRYTGRFGFAPDRLERGLASCLGSSALTVSEMVEAYSVFATLGDRVQPRFLTEVRNRRGELVERVEPVIREGVLPKETAWLMTDMLRDVVQHGTARRARALGVPVAGKTGTTNDYRDAWFIGYTPELVTGVWLGLDEFKSLGRGQYGGEVALPLWMDVMAPALEAYPPSEIERPPGLTAERYETRDGWRVPSALGRDPVDDIDAPLFEERMYRAADGVQYRSTRLGDRE